MLRQILKLLTVLSVALATCECQELQDPCTADPRSWTKSFDDPADYEVIRTVRALSEIQCVTLASRLAFAQLATFDPKMELCKAFRCRMELQHCKKCRNVREGNQVVWTASTLCWTTIQHRVSSAERFDRNYDNYKDRFGKDENEDFWIGLKTLYEMTGGSQTWKLRILMKLWNGSEFWAQYTDFSVTDESSMFKLTATGFSGSPGISDDLADADGKEFCAKDGPGGNTQRDCARYSQGAWWFGGSCPGGHLNGAYQDSAVAMSNGKGVIWTRPFGATYSLKEAEMLII